MYHNVRCRGTEGPRGLTATRFCRILLKKPTVLHGPVPHRCVGNSAPSPHLPLGKSGSTTRQVSKLQSCLPNQVNQLFASSGAFTTTTLGYALLTTTSAATPGCCADVDLRGRVSEVDTKKKSSCSSQQMRVAAAAVHRAIGLSPARQASCSCFAQARAGKRPKVYVRVSPKPQLSRGSPLGWSTGEALADACGETDQRVTPGSNVGMCGRCVRLFERE